MRIGIVAYLNTVPLICDLQELLPDAELIYAPPAPLADDLAAGRIEVGLVPVYEWFLHPRYRLVSDAIIACDGPVRSVTVYSKKPAAEIRSITLEPESRTSNQLLKIIFYHQFRTRPDFKQPLESQTETIEDLTPRMLATDARLAIGDRALRSAGRFPYAIDLGQEWKNLTGLPFVFACWFARDGIDLAGLDEAFSEARDRGLQRRDQLAQEAAPRFRLPVELCRDYFRKNILYTMTPAARKGLERFRDYLSDEIALD